MRAGPDAPPRRELTIPGTKKVVKATHLDGSTPAWRPRADNRQILAEWVTSPENPYFARAVVNRVWARFFGVGLIEPVDDLDGDADPELKSLLDVLAADFRAHGYNLKYLIRVMTATRAYNLSSVATSQSESETPMFATMPVRGLSASQLFDSLTQATGAVSPEARGSVPRAVWRPPGAISRSRDDDHRGTHDDERNFYRRRHQPREQRGPGRDRQGPVP